MITIFVGLYFAYAQFITNKCVPFFVKIHFNQIIAWNVHEFFRMKSVIKLNRNSILSFYKLLLCVCWAYVCVSSEWENLVQNAQPLRNKRIFRYICCVAYSIIYMCTCVCVCVCGCSKIVHIPIIFPFYRTDNNSETLLYVYTMYIYIIVPEK